MTADRSSERQRRYRARKAAGLMQVTITINDAVVDALVATGRLGEWDEENREAISRAIERMLGMHANDA